MTGRRLLALLTLLIVFGSLGAAGAFSAPPATPLSPQPASSVRLRSPTGSFPVVLTGYSAPDQRWQAGHLGVDLRVENGDVVLAPGAGTVSFHGWVVDREIVVIDHGGLRSTLEPIRSDLRAGDAVSPGQAVGIVGGVHASCRPAVCLHWGVRSGSHYLDPLSLLSTHPRAVLLS